MPDPMSDERLTALLEKIDHVDLTGGEVHDVLTEVVRLRAALAEVTGERDRMRATVNCGQDGVCATPPGCAHHWEERNRELVADRDLYKRENSRLTVDLSRAVAYGAEMRGRVEALENTALRPLARPDAGTECDWGMCSAPAEFERRHGDGWLPVCRRCAEKPD